MTPTADEREPRSNSFASVSPEVARPFLTNPDGRELLTVIIARLDRIEATLNPPEPATPHLTAKEAASYLRISYSTFRKKATKIRCQPGTRRYRVEDLDEFAASLRPRRKR
jgi:hypothetical protein